MAVVKWIAIALAALSLAGSFLSVTLANGALSENREKDFKKEQLQAATAAIAGVAWGALAIAAAIGEGAPRRRREGHSAAAPQGHSEPFAPRHNIAPYPQQY